MKKYYAELIGTFVLTFLGCGAAVSLNCGSDTASIVGTAVAFGLDVVAMAWICFVLVIVSRFSALFFGWHLFHPRADWHKRR